MQLVLQQPVTVTATQHCCVIVVPGNPQVMQTVAPNPIGIGALVGYPVTETMTGGLLGLQGFPAVMAVVSCANQFSAP